MQAPGREVSCVSDKIGPNQHVRREHKQPGLPGQCDRGDRQECQLNCCAYAEHAIRLYSIVDNDVEYTDVHFNLFQV